MNRSKLGKSNRRKGHDWEREVCRKLRQIDPTARRNLAERQHGRDIRLALPFCISCRCGPRPAVLELLKEASKDAREGEMIAACLRFDRQAKIVAMPFDDWLNLVREWHSVLASNAVGTIRDEVIRELLQVFRKIRKEGPSDGQEKASTQRQTR